MTEKPHSPDEQQPLIDRLSMNQAKHLSSQERQQILKELSEREGTLRAELEALNAYLTGQWDPKKIAEQYPEAAKKGYDFPPDATFQIPGKNARIEGDGRVSYRVLKKDHQKDRFGDWYKLTWDRSLFRPKVQEYAENAEKLKELIEASERANRAIPDSVRSHFEKIQKLKEGRDQAFERGKHFVVTFPRTSLEVHYSAPTAPEQIEMDIRLIDGGDPTDITNWRVDNEEEVVVSIKEINEQTFELKINRSYGDASSGEGHELKGTITVNTSTNQIVKGALSEYSGYGDGSYEAEYTLNK